MGRYIKFTALLVGLAWAFSAQAVPITLTQLTGLTGGSPAATGVYKADLNALGLILASITINDNSGALGGAAGQFSGFDLDAIVLSTTDCASAACAAGLTGSPNNISFSLGLVTAVYTRFFIRNLLSY